MLKLSLYYNWCDAEKLEKIKQLIEILIFFYVDKSCEATNFARNSKLSYIKLPKILIRNF